MKIDFSKIIHVIFLSTFLINVLSKNNLTWIGHQDYSIKLKIKGSGIKQVFGYDFKKISYPSKIIINNEEKNISSTSYDFSEEENTVEFIWDYIVKDCYSMFNGCSDITEIDVSNFDVSQVTYMNSMFRGCSSLTSLDLSNFDFSMVTCVEYMFYGCSKLEYINIYNFNKNVINEYHFTDMFFDVPNNIVICLNGSNEYIENKLSNKNCKNMACSKNWQLEQKKLINDQCYAQCYMTETYKYDYNGKCLQSCPNGEYADESNPSIIRCKCELTKCYSCPPEALKQGLCSKCNIGLYPKENDPINKDEYFDCYQFIYGYYLDKGNSIFKKCYESCGHCQIKGDSTNHNCITCSDSYPIKLSIGSYYNCFPNCNGLYYFDENNLYHCLNITQCPQDYNKKVQRINQCTNDCRKIPEYQYEFRYTCLPECPEGISSISNENSFLCVSKCAKEKPFELVNKQECTKFCGINDLGDLTCILNYRDEDINANLILNNIHEDILTSNFDKTHLINNNENIIIEEANIKFTLTTNKIQKSSNPSIISLGQCEDKLRYHYNIENIDNLIILVINVIKGSQDKKQFEVYGYANNENELSKLDLNICNDILTNNEISKCSDYSIESLLEDSCISCYDSYYPIYNENSNINSFIKCYKSPEGYYLDENEQSFKMCYISCQECKESGDETNHNCLSCKSNYFYELNIDQYINCYEICPYYHYHNPINNKYYCTKDESCPEEFDKLIPDDNICVNDCSKDNYYKYEFRHICYHECPLNISEYSENKNYFCEAICPKDFPFEVISTQLCIDKCSIMEMENELCKINYISNDENDKKVEEKAIENIQEEMTKDFDTTYIDKGKSVVVKQKDSTITISSTDNLKNETSINTTTINLGKCEDKIKEAYDIPFNKSLYILQIEVRQEGLKIPKTEYEVYYPLFGDSLIKLNLTACENLKIDLRIPVALSDDIKKLNSSSEYYNDICFTYTSEDGTDISLSDRQKQFVNNNLTLCEENCDFVDYDYSCGKAVCSCKVKTNSTFKIGDVVIDKEKLFDSFTDIKNIANINILKCYKLIFKLEAYKSNYANLVLIFIILLFFVSLILFFCKDYFELLKIIQMIILFKLNPQLVKKFLERIKREENEKSKIIKKIKQKNVNINIMNQKKIEIKNPDTYMIDGVPINLPIFSKFLNLINKNKKISNPIKKKLKRRTIKSDNTKSILNRLQTNNIYKNNINMEPVKEGNLNDNENYEMFLKINKYTYTELNELKYIEAIKLDKRTYTEYYISLICTKHILLFSFISKFDYNSKILKQFLFFFNFTVNFAVNALFFSDETMHKIYADKGSFNFIYNIPQIIYSSLITGFILSLIQSLALTDSYLINLKRNKDKDKNILVNKENDLKKILKIKFALFFFICFILLIMFWFYLACFCAVYKNTQIHLIKDTLISFGTSMIYPLFIYLIPGIFRILAINNKNCNKECMFKFSKLLQML